MPRVTRIDRSDAFAAIERVIARGEAPTHINIRAELGQRGSPPVISNFIGSWFACYGASLVERANAAEVAAPTATPAVVSADGGAIAALTAAALGEIERAASTREQEHQRTIDAARQALEQEQAALEERINAFQLREQGGAEHIQRCYSDRDGALRERDLALADAASLRQALGQAKAELAAKQAHLEQLKDLAERVSALARVN